MKRSLISALVLVIVAVVGLLLLTVNWSAGSGPVPAASNAQTPGSTPSVVATLTYSDFLALSATDIWSIPTPVHTPVIPTEWPFLSKPTYPTSTPRPTPTLLPDMGVRLGLAEELAIQQTGEAFLQFTGLPRIVYLDTDGKTLVGTIALKGTLTNKVIAIDLFSGEAHVIEGEECPYEPRVSEDYVVWTTSGQVHLYDLSSGQLKQLDLGLVRYARVSGQVVVWERDAVDIWGYDLETGQKFLVAAHPEAIEEQPELSADWVIYRRRGLHLSTELRATNVRTHKDISLGEILAESSDAPDISDEYAIDVPWIIWASEAELHLYNLDTHTFHTVTVEPCISVADPTSPPRSLRLKDMVLSGSTVIFSCDQRVGYDIEHDVFFSLPVHRSEIPEGEFDRWTISDDRLIWELTEDIFGPQEQSHIYTAQIERSP